MNVLLGLFMIIGDFINLFSKKIVEFFVNDYSEVIPVIPIILMIIINIILFLTITDIIIFYIITFLIGVIIIFSYDDSFVFAFYIIFSMISIGVLENFAVITKTEIMNKTITINDKKNLDTIYRKVLKDKSIIVVDIKGFNKGVYTIKKEITYNKYFGYKISMKYSLLANKIKIKPPKISKYGFNCNTILSKKDFYIEYNKTIQITKNMLGCGEFN